MTYVDTSKHLTTHWYNTRIKNNFNLIISLLRKYSMNVNNFINFSNNEKYISNIFTYF